MNNYGIKQGYRANPSALTFENGKEGTYWDERRLQKNLHAREFVYLECRKLYRRRACRNILDIGCGPAMKVRHYLSAECGDIVLVDQATLEPQVRRILPGCTFIPADLERDTLELDRKFDLVICSDVVEHLMDPDHCVDLIRDHLTSRGRAVITTPERDYRRGKHCMTCPNKAHVREWNGPEFIRYLESRGLKVEDHYLVPMVPVSRIEYGASRLFSAVVRNQRWSSCQVAVCRAA
jgi:SAM-dependent methyltransferase